MKMPFVDHVGARVVEADAGTSLLTLVIQPQHFNTNGVVHGAVLFTLADTGMGAALYPTLEPGKACATIEIKIAYFRPVLQGLLSCRSQLAHRGRSTASLESTLSVDGTVVGKATGTFAIFERRVAEAARQPDPDRPGG